MLSQLAATINLLNVSNVSISNLALVLSVFTLPIQLENDFSFELKHCFKNSADFILILLESADCDCEERAITLCEQFFGHFINVLNYFGKELLDNVDLMKSLLRSYIIILSKTSPTILEKIELEINPLMNCLTNNFEKILLKNTTVEIDELKALFGSALQATFAVSDKGVDEAVRSGLIERLIDLLTTIQIKISMNKEKVFYSPKSFYLQNEYNTVWGLYPSNGENIQYVKKLFENKRSNFLWIESNFPANYRL